MILTDLYDEILLIVFHFMNKYDLSNIVKVNKHLRRVGSDRSLWGGVCYDELSPNVTKLLEIEKRRDEIYWEIFRIEANERLAPFINKKFSHYYSIPLSLAILFNIPLDSKLSIVEIYWLLRSYISINRLESIHNKKNIILDKSLKLLFSINDGCIHVYSTLIEVHKLLT